MRILITGGAGFIGSALIRHLMQHTTHDIINFDKLTYAGNLAALEGYAVGERYVFVQADITSRAAVQHAFMTYQPDVVMHLAAESHVDRSIGGPSVFIQTNIMGTYTLLDCALDYWKNLTSDKKNTFRFQHISTDEVYGSLGDTGLFSETSPYQPNSPYSASKASSDHLVRAWHHTYGLPVLMTNCSNNYGPYQHVEKLIPRMISLGLSHQPMTIYGSGKQIRDWLHVEDHVRALLRVLTHGRVGEVYNIGGNSERQNRDVVEAICQCLDELRPTGKPHKRLICHVADRLGHDARYAIDSTKIQQELGWMPSETFEKGLQKTVAWYMEHPGWYKPVVENFSVMAAS